ncbi:hypothetical protein VMCG_02611 [Cytospora schulzeri]|uniref:OPT family small oligopeptide transporter n=1 Tax=Cytospora schulzeri TaxID=448051 RepID=A0A423X103_9PEZI|nr:hypothetical protein VMCG_02611 [Valsa malicola]
MSFATDEKTAVVSSIAESSTGEKDQSSKVQTSSIDEPQYDFDSEEFSSIPELVRNVVSFEDDPTLPVITFRSVLLSIVFCVIGSVVSQISYAAFPVFFVILVSQPLGRLLARVLPDYTVPLGRFSFSLNPGPFSIKEHAIIGIAANSGSQGQWASTSELHSKLAEHKMKIFYIITIATFTWQFLPEFVFPMLAVLAPLCWFAPSNHKINFLGSGKGGIGLLNFTLDWSNITSTVITYPYSVQLVIFVGFVITMLLANKRPPKTWILIPVAYFGNIWGSPTYDIMSNTLYTKNGTDYPFQSLYSTGNQQVNETRYEEIGLSYAGAQYTWGIFMWYASYISSYVWAGLFLAPKMWSLWKNRKDLAKFRTDRLK